jgi:hypothetical protein
MNAADQATLGADPPARNSTPQRRLAQARGEIAPESVAAGIEKLTRPLESRQESGRSPSSQKLGHSAAQFIQCEWLVQDRHVGVARNGGLSGDQQRLQIRSLQPRMADCLQTVPARQRIIDNQQVDVRFGIQNAERRVAAARLIYDIAQRSQIIGQNPSKVFIVVTEQHAGRSTAGRQPGSGRRLADGEFISARQP